MMMPRMRMPMRGPHPPMGPQGPPLRPPMHGPPHGRMPPPRPVMPGPGPVPQQQGPIVGSVTNDPATAASRVFVGNLNTIALSKEEVEGIFKRYGMVTGLSMHKGYAFIQYAKANDARRACMNEDGKTYANQTLDINIASEPKNRSGSQATAGSKRSVSQSNFTTYSSSTAKTSLTRSLSGGGPPAKKPRSDIQISGGMKRTLVSLTSGDTGTEAKPTVKKSTGKALSGKDVLICGVCKSAFASLHSLAQHKKTPCRLRFSCQCKDAPPPECPEPQVLFCANCDAQFSACWDLVMHAQQEHSVVIYKQEGDETTEVIEPKDPDIRKSAESRYQDPRAVSADDIVDRHICGACRTEFHNVDLFLLHKRQSCPALLRSVTDVSQGPGGLPADSSTDNSSSQAGDQGVVATPPSSVQQPPQPLIQDETIGTSLSAVDETGEGAGYMITPPQGHEYIQTSHRPQEATQSPPLRLQPQVLVTDKGEFILLQPDTQGRLSSDDTDHQNQAVVSLLQQLKASQNVNIANKENEFINSSEDQSGVTAQQGTSDRVPRMQLDHNGTFSLIPNSQLPANLQVPSSQSQTVTEESEAVEGIHQRQLTNPQQDVIYQSQALSESSQISSGIHVSPNMHDLAQQAARLSGVVDNDMQPVDITRVEQLESNQYAVHIRTMNQEPEADSVGPILQIPDSNIQEGLVIGPVRDCVSQAAVDSQIISSTGSTLLAQNEMVLGRNFPKKVKSHHSVSPAKSVSKSKVSSKVQSTPDKKNTPPKPKSVPSKRYTCNYDNCSFSTPYMKDLERHIRTHTGEKPYKCGHCVKAFSRVDKLRLHIRAHTGDKPYKCTYCAYSAVDSSSLKKHMIVHTDERPFQCQVCPYSCRNQSQLTVHLRTHTGDSPFPCPFCPSKFKIKSDLRRHLRVHTGEKPYTCEKCDARCATKGNLSSHMKVHHSEQNQMKCGECEFVTSSKKSLREHAKEHDYVDPECVCPVCKYKCANKEVLKNHSTTHEPDKPHKCVHCPFTTRYRANLMEHVKRKHFDLKPFKKPGPKTKKEKEDKARRGSSGAGKYSKLFECHLCPESFVRCDSLRSHVRLHEEMAKSTLSTALTVLKLQQPVIIPTSGDKQSDVSVQNATDHTHQIVDALQHGSVAESTGSGGHHITNTEVVDVVASRSYEQEIIERCKSGSNSDGTLRATYEFDGRNVEVTPLQVEYVSLNPVDNNTEPRPPEGSNPSDRERRYSDRVRHGTVNVPETCHYPIRLNQDKEQNSGHTQLSRETNLSANNSDRIFVVQSQSFDSQTTNVDPQFVSHGTQGNSHFTVSDMQMRSSAVQNMGGDSTEGVFLQNTPTSLPEQSDIQQTLNTPASEINTEPRPPQVCQIPSIQLVQNISFPLIRLPSGQIIPLNSQQSQQVLGSAQQQLSGDQSTFSNPSSVDEIQNEVETSPQHHNVPVQLMSPQTVTEGVAQMIDASGNSVPTTIQLVIPSSLSNVDSLKQAGVHTPTKAVNPTSGSPIVTPRGDVDSSRIQMQGKAISTLSDISQTLTMPGSTLLLGNDTVRQSGIPGSMVVTLPIQVTALPTDSEIAEDGCAQYPTVQNLVLNPNVRGQAHQQITGECKEIS